MMHLHLMLASGAIIFDRGDVPQCCWRPWTATRARRNQIYIHELVSWSNRMFAGFPPCGPHLCNVVFPPFASFALRLQQLQQTETCIFDKYICEVLPLAPCDSAWCALGRNALLSRCQVSESGRGQATRIALMSQTLIIYPHPRLQHPKVIILLIGTVDEVDPG